MHYLDYNEQIQHRTGDFPLAWYPVDVHHERYRMPMHWHRETELIYVRSGRLSLYIDDREAVAEPGDLMLIAGGVVHGGDPEDCVYECAVFDAGLMLGQDACARRLKGVLNHSIFLKAGAIEADEGLFHAVNALFRRCRDGVDENVLEITGSLYALFGALVRSRDRAVLDTPSARFGQKAEQLKPALEYIETHYGQGITLEELARLTGMSPKYFCRFFKSATGKTPLEYINEYRTERACVLLSETDMTLSEISHAVGFDDPNYFSRSFKKARGMSPSKYRSKTKEK